MDSMEKNKIFAAVLCAGIMAMLGGFIADVLVHPHELEEDAVFVESMEGSAGGPVKAQVPDPIMHLIATADLAKGEKLSKACAACHSFDNGGVDKVGPNLYGTVGGSKARSGSFAYSSAMAGLGGSWGYKELNYFLWKPKAYVEGTKMNYNGIKKPEDRAALIAWLRSQGSSGYGLPSSAQIAAEAAELAPPEPEAEETAVVEGDEEPAAN